MYPVYKKKLQETADLEISSKEVQRQLKYKNPHFVSNSSSNIAFQYIAFYSQPELLYILLKMVFKLKHLQGVRHPQQNSQ